jgi:hypothetical protein
LSLSALSVPGGTSLSGTANVCELFSSQLPPFACMPHTPHLHLRPCHTHHSQSPLRRHALDRHALHAIVLVGCPRSFRCRSCLNSSSTASCAFPFILVLIALTHARVCTNIRAYLARDISRRYIKNHSRTHTTLEHTRRRSTYILSSCN